MLRWNIFGIGNFLLLREEQAILININCSAWPFSEVRMIVDEVRVVVINRWIQLRMKVTELIDKSQIKLR